MHNSDSEKYVVLPSEGLRQAFYKMAYDYRDAEDRRYYKDVVSDGFDFGVYVENLRSFERRGTRGGLCPFSPPCTTFWMVDGPGRTIFGVSRLRHMLDAASRKEGGHIGYDVPPSLRGAGNATELLRLTVAKAREMGIARALVTCDADNAASARVIARNVGALENQVVSDFTKKIINRYWIFC